MNHIKNDLHPEKKRNNNKKELVFFKIKFQLGRPPDCLDKWRKELEDYAVPATDASRCCVFACVVDRPVFYFYGENKVDDGNHSYTQETKQQQPLLKNPSLFIFYFSSWIGRQQVFVLPIEAAESFSKWCVCVCVRLCGSRHREEHSVGWILLTRITIFKLEWNQLGRRSQPLGSCSWRDTTTPPLSLCDVLIKKRFIFSFPL